MFEWLEIEGFRGIRKLRMEGLARVNILVGANGCGKTTVLEALFLACGGANVDHVRLAGYLRGLRHPASPSALAALFNGVEAEAFEVRARPLENGEEVRFACTAERRPGAVPAPGGGVMVAKQPGISGVQVMCEIPQRDNQRWIRTSGDGEVPGPAPRSVIWRVAGRASGSDVAEAFGKLVLDEGSQTRHELVSFLSRLDPRITGAELLPAGGTDGSALHHDLFLHWQEHAPLPFEVLGEGLCRLFAIYLDARLVRDGCILIDELDLGLHHTRFAAVLEVLRLWSSAHDVQVFATTHSEELLSYALEAFKDEPDALRAYRLEPGEEEHRVVGIDYEGLVTAAELAWEMR